MNKKTETKKIPTKEVKKLNDRDNPKVRKNATMLRTLRGVRK